jgi:hypothetical protein
LKVIVNSEGRAVALLRNSPSYAPASRLQALTIAGTFGSSEFGVIGGPPGFPQLAGFPRLLQVTFRTFW